MAEGLTASELIEAKHEGKTVASHPRYGRPNVPLVAALDVAPEAILIDASPTDPKSGQPGLDLVGKI